MVYKYKNAPKVGKWKILPPKADHEAIFAQKLADLDAEILAEKEAERKKPLDKIAQDKFDGFLNNLNL